MMEDFSGLALPPLFGEHILEAELEPGGVELGPGEVMLMIMVMVIVMLMSVNGITKPVLSVPQCHEKHYIVSHCTKSLILPVLTPN